MTARTRSRIDTQARYGSKRESQSPPHSHRATARSAHPHPPPATSRTRALTTRDPHERGRQHTSLARIVPAIHSTSASSQMLDDERRRHDRLPRPPPGARIINNQPHTPRDLIPPSARTAGSHHSDIGIASTTTRSNLPHSRAFRERSCGVNERLLTNIPRTFLWCQRMLADEFSRVLESSLTTQQHRLVPRARRAQYAVCAFSIRREAPLRGALSDRTNAVAHRHASKVREQEREPVAAALTPSDGAIRTSSSPARDLAHTRTHHARPTRTRQATHITRAHRPRHPFDVGVVADDRRRATSS